jgi:hypothetical protein
MKKYLLLAVLFMAFSSIKCYSDEPIKQTTNTVKVWPQVYSQTTSSATTANSQASVVIVQLKVTKIVILKKITPGSPSGATLYKVRAIPYDSITHYAYVPIYYSIGDTLKLSDVTWFK